MNIIKFSENGDVRISTIIGVKKEFVEKSKFFGSYKKKESKMIRPLIEVIEEVQSCPVLNKDSDLDEEFVNIEFISSKIPLNEVEADFGGIDVEKINIIATMQKEIAEALMTRDMANLIIRDIIEKSNRLFNNE